jgi:hypothetical protein
MQLSGLSHWLGSSEDSSTLIQQLTANSSRPLVRVLALRHVTYFRRAPAARFPGPNASSSRLLGAAHTRRTWGGGGWGSKAPLPRLPGATSRHKRTHRSSSGGRCGASPCRCGGHVAQGPARQACSTESSPARVLLNLSVSFSSPIKGSSAYQAWISSRCRARKWLMRWQLCATRSLR